MLEKAMGLRADEVIIDLEDSVAPRAKSDALATVVHALARWDGPTVGVRLNPPRTPWCHMELMTLGATAGSLNSVIVPKVESAGDLAFVDRMLDGVRAASGSAHAIGIQALIETPAGLARAQEIAGASPRLQGLIIGYADLAASLGRPSSGIDKPELWLAAQDTIIVAARSHALQAIDGPYLGIADDPPFRLAAEHARDLGFDGKWAIHPSQIDTLNELFTPSAQDIAHARAVIDALEHAESERQVGAVAADGQMLDEAVRRSALRVLARAGRQQNP